MKKHQHWELFFTNDKIKNKDLNYNLKIEQFINCLNNWKKHKLSILGKITVIKTFALPKLIFPLTVLESPSINIINLIRNKMFEFLWEGKPDKIKRKTIIQTIENGGMKMIDIELFQNAIKASWVKRLTNDNNNGPLGHGNLFICLSWRDMVGALYLRVILIAKIVILFLTKCHSYVTL